MSSNHGCNPDDGLCYTLGDIAKDFDPPSNSSFYLKPDCRFDFKCNPGYKRVGTNWVVIAAVGAGVVAAGAAVYIKKKKAGGADTFASF